MANNKKGITFLTVAIVALSVLYFNESLINSSSYSAYENIVVADHTKLTSGSYTLQQLQGNNTMATFKRHDKVINSNKSQAIIFEDPAINAEAIAKFLNGNLPTTTPPSSNTGIPILLSQTGAFSDLITLTPSLGLIPYDMIEPFWSDGAAKTRWMAIPNDGSYDTADEQITFSNDDAWDFPRGSVLIKHFEVGGQRLETRFEVKGDDDIYYYLTYKWNAAETDATLLNGSLDEDVVVDGVTQSWHYPSRTECLSCHFPQNGSVLGPKTRNLNKAILYPSSGITMNQLVNFSELGLITETITTGNVGTYSAVAAKDDLSASLEDRARSYIDVNCSSCHNPTVDNVAMFDARYSTPLGNQNIVYGDVVYDEGLNNPKVIIPQDVANSMAHFRMNSTQTGIEMPPIAKDVVDAAGVQLIEDWINSLTPTTSSPPVALFSASTVNGPAPLSVDFDASASFDADNDPLTYTWDFGDGNTGSGLTISHIYTSSAEFTATLIVSDGLQSDQATTSIAVNNSNPGGNSVSFSDGTSTLLGQDNFSGLPMGVIDMNGDGKDDIVQFNNARSLRIQYQNGAGQQFTSFNHGNVSSNNQWGTAIADFDHNGFNDVMSGGAYDNLKIVKNNNGNNSYTQSTLSSSNIFLQGANFADINNDGWADIFACHDDAESRAFENNQDGTLTYIPSLIGTATTPSSDNSGNYASMWIDYDNDGDLDLYISKCRGGVNDPNDPRRINMLWQNDGNNNYTEVAEQANLKNGEQTWLSDFGDIDNDGDLDAIIINHFSGPNLMRNNGDGTFTEITAGSGLLPTLEPSTFYGIQGFFKDFNNDGFIDLMVSGDNHYLFYNNGDGTFQNATNPFNSNQIQSFSVGDINHDGFLDIYAGYANGLNSPSTTKDRIWLNDGNSNNFINIQLEGTVSNINAIGARVELYGTWGQQIRDVKSGEGYGLVNTFTQHFGIGVSTQIDKVVVKWPSGIVDEVLNPAINQFLHIIESIPTPTCFDGIQNGDETGVDCGGSCANICPCEGIDLVEIDVDFENGTGTDWTTSGNATTGTFIIADPTTQTTSGVQTQPENDHSATGINAFFTATNTSAGVNDIDGGTSIATSPIYNIPDDSDLSIWYFFGQRTAGDDAGDFFLLEYSIDGGTNYTTLASYGDETVQAQWTEATAEIPANSSLVIRVSAADGPNAGDIVEAGIDDLVVTKICEDPVVYTFNNNVWSPGDPNNVSSNNDTIVVQAGEAVISMDTAINIVTIEAGAALKVNSGVTLAANTTTLKSTSLLYSSLIIDGTIEGLVKYERFVNANSGGNDLISPPLSGQTWANFLLSETNATDILNDGNDNPRTYLFGPFDKATDWYVNYTDDVTTTLQSGTGYRAASVNGSTLTFTGTVLTTPVAVDIIYSGTNYADWNLIGNPYPSYISIADFLNYEIESNVKNIDILEDVSGIYGYDGSASDGWDVITLANAGNRLMAPGQGFLVSADVTHIDDYDIIFDTSMRVTGSDDDFIAGRNANDLIFLKLNASVTNKTYTTEFYFNDNASQGLDIGYDGKILGNVAPNFAIYSHLVQDDNGLPIALQALNPLDLTNTIIPLGVNSNQGEQITFSISETTLPSNIEVYLEDNVTNTITLLNSGDYTFTPNVELNGTGRFYLNLSSPVLSVGNNELDYIQIYTTTTPKALIIKGELNDTTTLSLYDIQGRLVLNTSINHLDLINTVDISTIESGVYFAKVFNDNQSKTQKVIIN